MAWCSTHQAVLKALGLKASSAKFAHNVQHDLPNGRVLVDSYHTSRYNVQTKRLTKADFSDVFQRIGELLAG
jgi:uracil-DNA glycosylase